LKGLEKGGIEERKQSQCHKNQESPSRDYGIFKKNCKAKSYYKEGDTVYQGNVSSLGNKSIIKEPKH